MRMRARAAVIKLSTLRTVLLFAAAGWLAMMMMMAITHHRFYFYNDNEQQVGLPSGSNDRFRRRNSSFPRTRKPADASATAKAIATAATATTTTTTLRPPCDTSGTHYFYEGRYHLHPESASFRRALSEGTYGAPRDKNAGLMYAVSGTEGFVASAFVPVIGHLRDELGIPDVAERRREQQEEGAAASSPQQQQQWGLALDPFACRLLAEETDILPFFDVLVVITPDDMMIEHGENSNVTLWDPYEHSGDEKQKNATNNKNRSYGVKSLGGKKKVMGVVSWGDRINRDLRYYVMGFKILALKEAPFPITSFIDVDLVPCRKDFDVHLLGDVAELTRASNYSLFDVAVTHVNTNYRKRHPSREDPLHYMMERRFNASEENKLYDSNIHNTMCTVLNTTSPRTRDFLRRAIDHYFATPGNDGKLKQNDQPSLGEAMYDTWKFYRSIRRSDDDEAPAADPDSGFRHIDMSTDRICRNANIRKRGLASVCPEPGSKHGKNHQCLLVHKTDGENDGRRRRKETKKGKGQEAEGTRKSEADG